MENLRNLVGCEVFVYGDRATDTDALVHTTIQEYDKNWSIITINSALQELEEGKKVTVLTLGVSFVMEFQGTIRKTDRTRKCRIALYRGEEKEKRHNSRYKVNIPAQITGIMIGTKVVGFPLTDITILNLSTSGILVLAPRVNLKIDSSFQIKMPINQKNVSVIVKVMWMKEVNETQMQYGGIMLERN